MNSNRARVFVGISIAVVFLFLGCGGGDGYGGDGGMMNSDLVQPNITDIQSKIFTPRCALSGCHVGPTPQAGLDLSLGNAQANLINVAATSDPNFLRVEPNDPMNSYLYMKLVNDPRIVGEQMPKGGPVLNSNELGAVFDWIGQGSQQRPGY